MRSRPAWPQRRPRGRRRSGPPWTRCSPAGSLARQLYVEGLEVADIAAALGLSSGRVQLFINDPDQRQTVTAATTALRAHASYGDARSATAEGRRPP